MPEPALNFLYNPGVPTPTPATFTPIVRRSARARRLSVTVYPDLRVALTVPSRVSDAAAARFLAERRAWVESRLARFRALPPPLTPKGGRRDYLKMKEAARALVTERLRYFNQFYGFAWTRVTIRNQKSRWGSCSRRGGLSFNYRLAHLPLRLADYVVVHELCHLREMNHGPRFWALVGKALPDHEARRRELRGGIA